MEDKWVKRLAVGLGVTALAVGAAMLATHYEGDSLKRRARELRKKIKAGWSHNPELEQLQMQSENTLFLPKNHQVQFYVKIISSEKFTKKCKAPAPPDDPGQRVDPFSPGHYGGLYIDALSDTHVLLYNKFHLVPYHVLIATRDFERQNTLLTENDFAASLLVMKALNSFVFFNSGPEAGASQEHKHLQAIPCSSFPNQSIPIDALIEEQEEHLVPLPTTVSEPAFFTLPEFKFQHVFCRFNPTITKNLDQKVLRQKAQELTRVYEACLKKLNNERLTTAYNLVLTKHWMFMVPRKCELAMDTVKINAVGFTGSFAVRSEAEYQFILNQDPFTILASVSFPL